MTAQATELLDILDLEIIDANLFRGQNDTEDRPRLFGGQVLAQAIAAANRTVTEDRLCHSAHGYFLRPGRMDLPVLYRIERIRDGRSFTTRRIVALQNSEAIFSMDASFQVLEAGLAHQMSAPDVPGPEDLRNDIEVMKEKGVTHSWALRPRPFECRSIAQLEPTEQNRVENPVWIKFLGDVPEKSSHQQQLLAYASDMGFVGTAFLPHQETADRNHIQMASLDHALWFHADPDLTDWLLFYRECSNTEAARGYIRGSFYNRDGVLIASAMQEGLIRQRA
ncbi:MAG: acyl-CoA thioesterase [Pseudomonadales bacterium]